MSCDCTAIMISAVYRHLFSHVTRWADELYLNEKFVPVFLQSSDFLQSQVIHSQCCFIVDSKSNVQFHLVNF